MENTTINSDDYLVRTAAAMQQTIKACLPKKEKFMVHPAIPLEVYVTYYQGHWHLVNAEIVASGVFVPGLLIGYLYPAITEAGRPFVLVVSKPLSVTTTSWFESWQEIIEIAHHKFVEVITNVKRGRYDYCTASGQGEPVWPEMEINTWLMAPFVTHSIDSEKHPIFAHSKESYYPEESDNEFEE